MTDKPKILRWKVPQLTAASPQQAERQRAHLKREALLDKMAKKVHETVHDCEAYANTPGLQYTADINFTREEARSMVTDLMDMMEKSHGSK